MVAAGASLPAAYHPPAAVPGCSAAAPRSAAALAPRPPRPPPVRCVARTAPRCGVRWGRAALLRSTARFSLPPHRPPRPRGGTALKVALRGSPHVISPPRRHRRFQAGPATVAALRGGRTAPRGRPRPAEGPSAGRACLGWRRLGIVSSRPGEPRREGRGGPAPLGPGFPQPPR